MASEQRGAHPSLLEVRLMASQKTTKDDRIWRQLRQKIKGIARAKVRVGVIGNKRHVGGISMAELAAIHEFGAPNAGIPARPFLVPTFQLKRSELVAFTEKLARKLLNESIDIEQALGLLGAWAAAAVKKTITSQMVTPRLADSAAGRRTIARKGSSVTLVDTGQLLNSITWAVEKHSK